MWIIYLVYTGHLIYELPNSLFPNYAIFKIKEP